MIKVPTSRKDNGSFRAVIRCSQAQRTIAARWDNWTQGSLLIFRGVLWTGVISPLFTAEGTCFWIAHKAELWLFP